MDIRLILTSKPHNIHYLNRYIRFIESCKLLTIDGYSEKHHICPAAQTMFPEYKSFKSNSWNLVNLSARQHFIAHWLLWKAYNNSAMTWAFMTFTKSPKQCNNKRTGFSSRTFELLRKTLADECRKRFKGKTQDPDVISHRANLNRGKTRPKSAIVAASLKNTGMKRTPEFCKKNSEIARSRPKVTCEYCGLECSISNHTRWHGHNCKQRIV